MPVRRGDGGHYDRRGLVNVEYPRNVVRRIARLEEGASLPRGGVRGGGDPNFGYRIEVPLIVDVEPHAVYDGTRFVLSLEIDLAYPTPVPTGFRYIEVEIDGNSGFHATARLSPYSSPWTIEDIGLEPDQEYQVRVRAVLSRGASEWGDWFTGITFGPSFFIPGDPTDFQIDTGYGIDGFGYLGNGRANVGVEFTPPVTEPQRYTIELWSTGPGPSRVFNYEIRPGFYTLPFIIGPLAIGSSYEGQIVAWNGAFQSAPALLDEFTVPDPPMGPATDFEIEEVQPNSEQHQAMVKFSWVEPADMSLIYGWELNAILNGGTEVNFRQRVGLITALSLLFAAGTTVEAWVQAIDEWGAVSPLESNHDSITVGAMYGNAPLNRGFEDAKGSDPTQPAHWNYDQSGLGITAGLDTSIKHSGNQSIKLETTITDTDASYESEFFYLAPDVGVVVEVWVKNETILDVTNVYLNGYDANFDLVETQVGISNKTISTTDWFRYAQQLALSHPDVVYATVVLRNNAHGTTPGEMHYDDLSVTTLSSSDKMEPTGVADGTYGVGDITVDEAGRVVDIVPRTITDAEHGSRAGGNLHPNAVASGAAGFMSGADKAKLDGVTAGAAVASVGATAPITSSGGTNPNISISAASGSSAGSMSAADKTKLDDASSGLVAGVLVMRDANARFSAADPTSGSHVGTKTYIDNGDAARIANSLVDAKGDLLTATANDTPARLGVGTNDFFLAADSSQGTGLQWRKPSSAAGFGGSTLPSSPSTGDRFFYTTYGVWVYYDGSRWLGVNSIEKVLVDRDNTSPLTYSATTLILRKAIVTPFNWWFERVDWRARVNASHSSTNRWTLNCGIENNGLGGAVQSALNTSTVGSNSTSYINYPGTSFTNNPMDFSTTNYYTLFAEAVKVASPGNLDILGVVVTMRRVYT